MCHNHHRSYLNHMTLWYIVLLAFKLQETNNSAFIAHHLQLVINCVGNTLCGDTMQVLHLHVFKYILSTYQNTFSDVTIVSFH